MAHAEHETEKMLGSSAYSSQVASQTVCGVNMSVLFSQISSTVVLVTLVRSHQKCIIKYNLLLYYIFS